MSTIPRQNDVLFGKGTSINSHHGNIQFRDKVALQKPIFVQTKRTEKRNVAMNIVNNLLTAGGRFLMEDPNTSTIRKKVKAGGAVKNNNIDRGGCVYCQPVQTIQTDSAGPPDAVTDPFILEKVWVQVDKDRAIEKVMHRLREKMTSVGQQQQPTEREISSLRGLHVTETKPTKKNNMAAPQATGETNLSPQRPHPKSSKQGKSIKKTVAYKYQVRRKAMKEGKLRVV